MQKIIILDGCDHAGKTNIITTLLKAYPRKVAAIKFPSDELAASPLFVNVIKDPSDNNRTLWITALIQDIEQALAVTPEKPIILIDRMWVSTLLYQGDGLQSIPTPFVFERVILNRYHTLFDKMKIDMSQITTIIFRYPFVASGVFRTETNPAKLILDQRVCHYARKLGTLLKHVKSSANLESALWRNVLVFAEENVASHYDDQRSMSTKFIEDVQRGRMRLLEEAFNLRKEA